MYRVNFLPVERQPGAHINRRRLILLASGTLAAGLCIIALASIFWNQFTVRNELLRSAAELGDLQETVERYNALRAEGACLEQAAAVFNEIQQGARPYKLLLDEVTADVPIDIWFTSLELIYNPDQVGLDRAPDRSSPSSEDGTVVDAAKQLVQNLKTGQRQDGNKDEQPVEEPLPEHPNEMLIKGLSRSLPSIGVLVRNLGNDRGVTGVELKEIQEQQDGTLSFIISCHVQGGAPDVAKAE